LYTSAFFALISERADIFDLEVSNDALSFGIIKLKIKTFAAAGLVGSMADYLSSYA
jgi:hypothetical protein